ncbi:MAG: hypothetical protein GY899_08910 [Verrucomicrobiaceae bacterium]|nr:hypothetical protein [Verrucomicrobiaceae bacterium]
MIGILAWIARGVYDHHFMMEGAFHVVSHSAKAQEVLLKFPSGKTKAFNLKPGASTDFRLMETGEGSIAVSLNGKPRATVGYVTTMNGIVVLVIGDKTTSFSQIFPALKPYPLAQTTRR